VNAFAIDLPAPLGPMLDYSREFSDRVKELIQPNRFNLVVRLYRHPEITKGGIVMTQKSKQDADISGCAAQILVTGPECWRGREHPNGNSLGLKIGDWIMMQSYAGGQIRLAEYPDEEMRVIADTEIIARISDPEQVNRKL
jgi:co-chaperonin GroES (HSP10)